MDDTDVAFLCYRYIGLGIVALAAIVGNILISSTIIRHRHLRTAENMFYLALSVTDLTAAVFYPLYNLNHAGLQQVNSVLGKWPVCLLIICCYVSY